jgi:hypothetical protein
MANLLRWKVLYQIASVAAGAMAGIACGHHLSGWTWGGPVFWLKMHTDDAAGWATIGAVAAGIVIYGMRAVSRPRRSSANAAPVNSRNRSQPPRTDVTGPASSRRKKDRSASVSLQEALQGCERTSRRA